MSTATRKITAKVNNFPLASGPPSRTNSPRPPSPIKLSESRGSGVSTTASFKPKAKVNSSATVIRKSPSVVSSASVTPRPGSPSKLTRAQNGNLSPTFQPRVPASSPSVRSIVRSQTPVSAPGTPEARSRTLGGSEVAKPTFLRTREGSVSQLHHAMSFSSLQSSSKQQASATSPTMRIRSKVSGISKSTNEMSPTTPPSQPPTQPIPAQPHARLHSPSASSNVSQTNNAPTQFYPITTGSPAANPHRYNPMRPATAPSHQTYIPPTITVPDTQFIRPRLNGAAKVDFNSIPPAPASPPISTLSFSSRSSISLSSASFNAGKRRESGATVLQTPPSSSSPRHQRHGSSNSVGLADDIDPQSPAVTNEHHEVKAEAKSNRKIADLEISNRSLLTINASLEATKNKQAKEIRYLRRKLRESRLLLPPGAYRQAKSSWGPEAEAPPDEDSDEDSELEDATQGNGDEIYKRVKVMIESLIVSGKQGLEKKVEDFAEGITAKVLTAEEVQSWQRSNDDEDHSDFDSVSQGDVSYTSTIDDDDDDDDDNSFGDGAPLFNHDIFSNIMTPPIRISEAQ